MTATATEIEAFIHPHALVESTEIGRGTRIWAFAHVMSDVVIGSDCNICDHVFIEAGAKIGNGVTIKNGVAIWDCVTIDDHVFLGPNCVLTNDLNPRAAFRKSRGQLDTTHIYEDATIGANATIVCGVTIGRGAFIGAGAVVTRSIPDFALVLGNPARHTGWMCLCANKLDLPVAVQKGAFTTCVGCGRKFTATNRGLSMH